MCPRCGSVSTSLAPCLAELLLSGGGCKAIILPLSEASRPCFDLQPPAHPPPSTLAPLTQLPYRKDWLFAMGVADGEDGGCACAGGANHDNGGGDADSNGKPLLRQGSSIRNGEQAGVARAVSPEREERETSPAATALTQWLAGLGLGVYESRLVYQGFDTLEAMGTATEPDLEAMGFKKGHLRLLLARAPSAASFGGSASGGSTSVLSYPAVDNSAFLFEASSHNDGRAGARGNGSGDGAGKDTEEGREGEEDDDDQYCDAQALQPLRALSIGAENNTGDGGNGGADGFKELRPEEVEVGNIIGEGSFGVVRRGQWRGMDVAVKELKTCIASAAAAAAAGSMAATEAGAAASGRGVDRPRLDSTDGEEEMRHEARMLAKVCNHVW